MQPGPGRGIKGSWWRPVTGVQTPTNRPTPNGATGQPTWYIDLTTKEEDIMDTNEIDFIFSANTASPTEDIMESSDSEIFNDLEDIMDREIATPLIVRLDYETPITVNALAKVAGLSQTALTIALVALGGRVGVKDGGLIRLPEPEVVEPATRGAAGPRGPTAKTAPRQTACREALMSLVEAGPVTAKDLLGVAEGRFIYTDILLIARTMIEEGAIVETRKGRKASWSAPSEE